MILIVEDEAILAMTLEAILSDAGYRVIGPASTLSRAIELASATPPTIAFVNIRLRDGSSGIEVAQRLHKQFATLVFYASGQTQDARRHQEVAIGVVTKPYDKEAILAAVDIANRIRSGGPIVGPLPPGVEVFSSYRQ